MTSLTTGARKERKESREAAGPLGGKKYDEMRSATLVRMPHAELEGRAPSHTTDDDLVAAAEMLEDLLALVAGVDEDHPVDGAGDGAPTGEAWALKLLLDPLPNLDAAVKENNEAVEAGDKLQKAKEARAKTRAVPEQRLIGFRRVVRDVLGIHSREFRCAGRGLGR